MDPCGTPNFTKSKFVFFFVIYLNILLSVIQSFLNHLKKLLHLFYQQISFFNSENHFIQHIFYKTVLVGNVLFWWEMFSRTAILINIFLGGLSVVNCSLLRVKGMEKLVTIILISRSSKKEGGHELLVCSFNDWKRHERGASIQRNEPTRN